VVTASGATSVTIDGSVCASNQPPIAAGQDGNVYFNFTAGGPTYTSMFCF
jgi:hypothetical protein